MGAERLDAETRKLVSQITKLSVKIEQNASDSEKAGFFQNRYGSYDREDWTAKLFALFDVLMSRQPNEEYFRYLFAGALARASRLAEAEAVYRELREAGGTYGNHAEHMLISVYLQLDNTAAASEALRKYNERMISDGFPQLQRTLANFKC